MNFGEGFARKIGSAISSNQAQPRQLLNNLHRLYAHTHNTLNEIRDVTGIVGLGFNWFSFLESVNGSYWGFVHTLVAVHGIAGRDWGF